MYKLGLAKDYYIDGQNTQLIFFEKNTTGGGPPNYTPGVDFLDHDLLWFKKIHIKIYPMRDQTLFSVHYKLVIELLKHNHFLTNYLKLQILASYNNLKIE